ncbi:hypothetical protein SAMN02745857_03677 [Andreprevotia lacus DSM 23236]|uniref:Uncharacterized protein n=1 Tax=Andreprevotia lacus DSM 23236 TaxID=1121001 RepID=A0A1W1XZA0_9NEIS|nr:hypothetical protein [Andreprevotia lacus]SMC29205.1 hypothetical protein SAMN02745857_03677 [Andreprevotia lacus DSM 23236]
MKVPELLRVGAASFVAAVLPSGEGEARRQHAPPELPVAEWDGSERRVGDERRQGERRAYRRPTRFDTRARHERRREGRRHDDTAPEGVLSVKA